MGQPLIRIEVMADSEGLKVRLGIAPSILTQVYARDGRRLERQPILVEFVPASEDAEDYAPKFRPGSAFELA